MRTDLHLKTPPQVLAEIEARLNDTGNALATDAQYYQAINEGVLNWGRRVTLPHLYEFTSGFTTGTYEYVLPSYVRPPFRVQIRSTSYNGYGGAPVSGDTSDITWHTLAGYDVEPADDGTYVLRLPMVPYTEDARIIWYAENGPIYTTTPFYLTNASTISATATSVSFVSSLALSLADAGYIKLGSEWMSYAGILRNVSGSTTFTLQNLKRGLFGTEASTHDALSAHELYFGIGVDDQRLWIQLLDYVTAYVHALNMQKATGEDSGRHEKLMSFYQQKADNFWRVAGYVSQRKPSMVLTSRGMGSITW